MRVATWALLAVLAPAIVRAQSTEINIFSNLLLPNYDRVPVGQREALEAGAYLARTDDAVACWYNPAGLALSASTQVAASGNAYEAVSIELLGRRQRADSFRLSPLGGYFGVAIAEPVFSSSPYRAGFSITQPIAWQPGSIHFIPEVAPQSGLAVVNDVGLSRFEAAATLARRTRDTLRFGASAGMSFLSLSQHQDVLVRSLAPTDTWSHRRTLVTDGSVYHLFGRLGAQWDATPRATLGAVIQSPGLRTGGSTKILYSNSRYDATGFEEALFSDLNARFDYRLPYNAAIGAAYRSERWAFEADLRYYGQVGTHDLFRSERTGTRTVVDSTGTTLATVPVRPTPNAWRDVLNVAVGGNYQVSEHFRLHAGFVTDGSPVADPGASIFRHADLLTFSTGVSLTMRRFSGALGLGYSTGESDIATAYSDAQGNPVATTMQVQSLRVSYAVSFTFD